MESERHQESPPADALPPLDFAHVARVVAEQAASDDDRAARAQISAAAALIAAAPALLATPEGRDRLERAVADAMERGDLDGAVESAAVLASFDRARVAKVDWSAAGGS